MLARVFNRQTLALVGATALIAGCAVVPKATGPAPTPAPGPSADILPDDVSRHRVALLVPLTGENAAVGTSIANAATMAILDTNAQNLRVTNYDTSAGTAQAARRAIADGNKLILGPLLSENIPVVIAQARPANVPLISFSNDAGSAARDVFIMGNLPSQSVTRTVNYAMAQGVTRFAALVPRGDYGKRSSDALMATTRNGGGSVVAMEAYDRSQASIAGAARRLKDKSGYGAVLIADGGRMSSYAAPLLKQQDSSSGPRILGTELWSGEKLIASSEALEGAWFSAVADNRFGQFSASYKRRFGDSPYRIATLGYDAVLLTLRIAREWKVGRDFPARQLLDSGGFLGLDGPFRFSRDGLVERALEVRQVKSGNVVVVSPAPARFDD